MTQDDKLDQCNQMRLSWLFRSQILQPHSPQQFKPVQDRIVQAISLGQTTGIAIAVVYKGQILWEDGYGFANRENIISFRSNTPTLVTTFAKQGLIELDSPAAQYLQTASFSPTST